jgi:hypothetical protein
MREASRALALDPTNTQAQQLVARLVIEPPRVPPAAAIAQADTERGKARARVFLGASGTYASLIVALAVLFVFPVHYAWPILTTMGLLAAMSILFAYLSRKVLGMASPWFALVLILNTLTMMSASFILGPMLVLPIFLVLAAGFIMPNVVFAGDRRCGARPRIVLPWRRLRGQSTFAANGLVLTPGAQLRPSRPPSCPPLAQRNTLIGARRGHSASIRCPVVAPP